MKRRSSKKTVKKSSTRRVRKNSASNTRNRKTSKVQGRQSTKRSASAKTNNVKQIRKRKIVQKKFETKLLEEKKDRADTKEKRKLRITEKKIIKLLDFDHLEELFYLIHLLDHRQIDKFLEHYKNKEVKSKDKKIDSIINRSNTSQELIKGIKEELIKSLNDEFESIKDEISYQRKKGEDTYIESVKSMAVPLKIKMFNSTENKEDFYKAKKILSLIKESLQNRRMELDKKKKEKEKTEKKSKKLKKRVKEIKENKKI